VVINPSLFHSLIRFYVALRAQLEISDRLGDPRTPLAAGLDGCVRAILQRSFSNKKFRKLVTDDVEQGAYTNPDHYNLRDNSYAVESAAYWRATRQECTDVRECKQCRDGEIVMVSPLPS
jgi:hypothetical protein